MQAKSRLLTAVAVILVLFTFGVVATSAARVVPPAGSPAATLTIYKTVSPEVMKAVPNGVLTYTITLSNTDTMAVPGVMMTDTLPTLLSFGSWVEQPAGATNVGDTIMWTGSVLDSVEFVFTALLPSQETITLLLAEGQVVNTATFTYLGGSGSASATTRFYRYIYMPLVMKNY